MPKQWRPDAIDEVLVVNRIACPVAENVFRQLACDLVLFLECVVDDLAHLDVAHAAVRLEFIFFTQDNGFTDIDQAALEVDVLPLQSVDFSRAHGGKDARFDVRTKIHSHRRNQQLHFSHRERHHLAALHAQRLDAAKL